MPSVSLQEFDHVMPSTEKLLSMPGGTRPAATLRAPAVALSLLVLITVGVPAPVSGQRPADACGPEHLLEVDRVGSARAEFGRLAQVAGRAPLQSGFVGRWSDRPFLPLCGPVPWPIPPARSGPSSVARQSAPTFRALPVHTTAILNTGYPNDRNNGALWAGRGTAAELSGGVALRWGPFTAALAPSVTYQQNLEFPASPWRDQPRIDWPQRFGNTSFATLEPGQSFLRVDGYGVAAGISTENFWLGPGTHTSILMSNTAPGFAHLYVGTARPVDVYLGDLEVQGIWGRLEESRWFDDNEANDDRLFTALVATFEPAAFPGLYLGAARIFQQNPEYETSLFPFLQGFLRPGGADRFDQFMAVYARWVLPKNGFEAYLEWARTDASGDLHATITEPDHSAAWVAGFQKVEELGDLWLHVYAEIANLNPRLPALHRTGKAFWYRHEYVQQGYTNRGQLMGASIGPGADSQLFGANLLSSRGSAGLFLERVRRLTDYLFFVPELRRSYPYRHDVELTAGANGLILAGDFEVETRVSYSHRRNRDFLPPETDQLEQGYRVESNWSFELGLTWRPDG